MNFIYFISTAMVPLTLFYMVGMGILGKRSVFEDFMHGVKDGMKTVAGILPSLIGLMTAVGILRASGFLDFLGDLLKNPAAWIHLPAPLVPVVLVRLVSNAAATGLVLDLFKTYGVDSPVGVIASVMLGSTETVMYTLSIYFGSIGIRKTRWALPGALLVTGVGVMASVILGG